MSRSLCTFTYVCVCVDVCAFSITTLQIGPPTAGVQIAGAPLGAISYMFPLGITSVVKLNGPTGVSNQPLGIPKGNRLPKKPLLCVG